MSLLDDVSIVVTPNGYKAGELYAVIPSNGDADMDVTRATAATRVDENGLVNYAEVITGSNIITDGDFPNGSTAWALNGWTISNNTANCSGITANMIQAISGSTNKTYSLTFTISNYVSGIVTPAFVGGYDDSLNYSSNGTFTEVISSASDTRFVFYGLSFNGSIDNVSVKEVTRDNVPRIDYTGGGCPHILAEPMRTNIVFPSDVAVTQTRTVTAVAYALSFYGTGSIVLSGTHSATLTGTGVNDRVDLIFTPTAGSLVLTVSGTVTNFQLEVGSYATSLIPTVSGTVTRNQDIFTRDGIGSLINSTEGVLFVEMAALSDDLTYRSFMLNDGTDDNRMIIRYSNASNTLQALCYISTGLTGFCQYVLTDETLFSKIAFKWKVNDFALWVDGVEVATDTSGAVPTGLNTLEFKTATDTQHLLAKVKQLQVYDTSLSDTQLAALTS